MTHRVVSSGPPLLRSCALVLPVSLCLALGCAAGAGRDGADPVSDGHLQGEDDGGVLPTPGDGGTAVDGASPMGPPPIPDGVFVAPAPVGSDTGSGTANDPTSSLAVAMQLAHDRVSTHDVYLASGTYEGSVTLLDGVSLHGARDPEANWRMTNEPSDVVGDATAVWATNLQADVVLEGLRIHAADARDPGESSYVVRLVNSTATIVVRDSELFAGQGADGAPGADGASGALGATGGDGSAGCERCEKSNTGGSGAWGGALRRLWRRWRGGRLREGRRQSGPHGNAERRPRGIRR
jgi:hypothetical protein